MRKNHFNLVAPFYDRLARLVFGRDLLNAQEFFLNEISVKDRVLIVGGGSGEILRHPALQQASQIDFVELSEAMVRKAKAQPIDKSSIQFYVKDIRDHEGQYDWVICNFFLDCFQEESLHNILEKLKPLLKAEGQMLVTDFHLSYKREHRFLLYLMISFFRYTANLEASKLLDIDAQVQRYFHLIDKNRFNKGLIFTARYSANERSI